MAVDELNRTRRDPTQLDLGSKYDVAFWSRRFGITHQQLEAIVLKVGNLPDDVHKFLRQQHWISQTDVTRETTSQAR
ncbi:MAG: hypothetical protein JWN70_2129 [Planctomycetaceae bacterium]|nr:hypothetical protein [Planctomycetaceae bacterium]